MPSDYWELNAKLAAVMFCSADLSPDILTSSPHLLVNGKHAIKNISI